MDRAQLRRYAVRRSLFRSPAIGDAIRRLGYVQADPIRAPARAQDLILFQRVEDYRIDDLETRYASLPVFEADIVNYGFFHQDSLKLLYPRALSPRGEAWARQHRKLLADVQSLLLVKGSLHPREAEMMLKAGRRTNGWGGTSSATTLALELLHRRGDAHVVRREQGIRIYSPANHGVDAINGDERAERLVRLLVELYAPMTMTHLMPYLRWLSQLRKGVDCLAALERLVMSGELTRHRVDGIVYVWPAAEIHPDAVSELADEVRLLAPFDPIVWDRKRFAHFWGWDYRFEAYTPAAKRVRGYYALPMLWRDTVVGWANARVEGGHLVVEPGIAVGEHPGRAFTRALEAECVRMATFLSARTGAV